VAVKERNSKGSGDYIDRRSGMTEWKKSVDSERGSWKRFCPLPGKFSTGAHDSIV